MFLRLRRNLPILMPHQGLVVNSFGHVDELADALLVMATHPGAPGEIFNISGVGVTAEQYVRTLAEIVGADAGHPAGPRGGRRRSSTGRRSAGCSRRGTTA